MTMCRKSAESDCLTRSCIGLFVKNARYGKGRVGDSVLDRNE